MGHVNEKPDEHSLVLSASNNNKYFHQYIPAFDIKYIEDCFKLKDYPDPTKYMYVSISFIFLLTIYYLD